MYIPPSFIFDPPPGGSFQDAPQGGSRRRRSNHQTDLGPDPGQAIAQRPDQIGG